VSHSDFFQSHPSGKIFLFSRRDNPTHKRDKRQYDYLCNRSDNFVKRHIPLSQQRPVILERHVGNLKNVVFAVRDGTLAPCLSAFYYATLQRIVQEKLVRSQKIYDNGEALPAKKILLKSLFFRCMIIIPSSKSLLSITTTDDILNAVIGGAREGT
jgi:hypothetical protein